LGDTPKLQRELKASAGSLVLGLGSDEGMAILGDARAGDTRPLAEALARARAERDAPPTRTETFEHDAERASSAMRKVREVLERFTEIAEGRIDAGTLGKWGDELLDRMKGLDPDEHWQERLQVLRTLVVLLVLLGRWLELAQSLSDAVQAAKRIGDKGARAWALHELGTLHLAAEQNAEADDDLSEALRLRMKPGGGEGLRVTEANLGKLCKRLRSQLHHAAFTDPQPSVSPARDEPTPGPLGWLVHKPVLLLVLGLAVLIAGGVAGAAIAGESSVNPHPLAIVIEAVPASPEIGEPIAFRTKVENRADPSHYNWLFGDGEGTNSVNPTHVYMQPGRYIVTVAVSGAHNTAAGEATRMVIVRPPSPSPEAGAPAASFSFTPSPALVGHAVRFNASDSSDPDTHATISNYLWNFGDGHTQTGADPTHVYAEPGAHTVELVVADTRGASGRTTRTIRVEDQTNHSVRPAFTSATSATFAVGTSARFPVTATGKPTPKITESGTLPNDVSFLNNTLTGTPTTTGTFPLTFTVTNSAGKAMQDFILTVESQLPPESKPTFTSADTTNFAYGREERFQVTATGEPPPKIALEGKLPQGVQFKEETLVGAAQEGGTFPLRLIASNKAGSTVQAFTLKVIEEGAP
jgi:PKD repeat protein